MLLDFSVTLLPSDQMPFWSFKCLWTRPWAFLIHNFFFFVIFVSFISSLSSSRHHVELSPATAADACTDALCPSGSRLAVGAGRRADDHAEHSSHHGAGCPSYHGSSRCGNHSQDLRAQRFRGDSSDGWVLHKPCYCTDALRTLGII